MSEVTDNPQSVLLVESLFRYISRSPEQSPYVHPLKDVTVDLTKEYPPMDYLLTRNGVGCIPRGDIQGLGGKMKCGKTTAGLCIIVALLRGEFMGFKATKDNYKCLIVDTEQSILNAVEKVKIVHRLVGWPVNANNKRLVSISLRKIPPVARAELLAKAIEIVQPDFVLLDGVADICTDFMDSIKSRETIEILMKLSKTCAIMCVLHINKKDEEFRGHLGTELMNKCSEAYVVSKTDNIANVKQVVCRNEQLTDWAFSIGDDGVPADETILSKADKKKDELSKTFAQIFQQRSEYSYSDLVTESMRCFGVKERSAKSKILEARNKRIICKNEKGLYCYGDFTGVDVSDATPQTDTDDLFS